MSRPLELVAIGAGQRGSYAYGSFALKYPKQVRYVAVAEPNETRRKRFVEQHDIGDDHTFSSWQELIEAGQLGQGAVITTQDQMHVAPAIAAMEAGYHVLLEKPMAHTLEGCVQLVQAAERTGKSLQICHVLRYTPFWRTLNEVVKSGKLGRIITVEHRENVAYWHMAHSFVRGNWSNEARSTPMILAKCCHDLDILHWNLGRCKQLSSVGSLLHYTAESVGPEIPLRCTDNCPIEKECAFSAVGIYLEFRPFLNTAKRLGVPYEANQNKPDFWPFSAITDDVSYMGRLKALKEGPYGRCVYRCDNDVVDHQVVTMEFESGASVLLVMHGHSHEEERTLRIDGANATLRARFGGIAEQISIHYHATGEVEDVRIDEAAGGHGGGDVGIMRDFVRVLQGESAALTTARESLESHLMAFAAEEARLNKRVIDMEEFRNRAEELARK